MGEIIKIAIRADGSPFIGMGHIIRCLTLGREFRKAGCQVYFISKYKEGIQRIEYDGFEVFRLSNTNRINIDNQFFYGESDELKLEAGVIAEFIKKNQVSLLCVDSYNVTKEFFLKLKPFTRLLYIDDINKFSYPVDMLLNGNITAKYLNYEMYYPKEALLLGLKYNLIRDEFQNLPEKRIKLEVNELMITTGGADPYHLSEQFIEFIIRNRALQNLKINVVIGDGFVNTERLHDLSKKFKNIILHERINKISNIMLNSDIAISSGGSTLYELSACGTPTLAFIYADNQELIVRELTKLGYLKNLGWFNNINGDKFLVLLKFLINNYSLRVRLCHKGRNLVDGMGAKRVVEVLINKLEEKA
jgi:UDP-2,4-diacetamido-2,4,6-trideoxy-beta-L-altropyranose hydrolase